VATGRHLRVVPAGASMTDEELLVRTGRGDRAAFEQLYDAYSARVHGLARRILRDPTLSQDATQVVMTEVWRTAARFDPERGSATTWILTLAHRRSVDMVRREQASRDRIDEVGRRRFERPTDTIAEGVVMADEHAEVRAAMAHLTDLQREAIELAWFDGYTYREVAAALDVPLGTVKTRMRDGMIRLRDHLGVTT
jgi:RNA polymerase sigma-70 factor (ECF subfamily)